MRLLLVEDEINLSDALVQILKKNNYTTDAAYDGEEGLDCALSGIYDLIILDVMLPKMNGIEVLQGIREDGIAAPVLMLTAKNGIQDRVAGLDAGADDYLTKPFSTEELLARIRAMGRRQFEMKQDMEGFLSYGDIQLNIQNLKMKVGPKEIKLTLKECELLEFLILRGAIASPKEMIIEKLWGYDSEAEHNHVEVYISFLRKKLKTLKSQTLIETVRGIGYVLEAGAFDV